MDTSEQLKHCVANCSCSRLGANFTATNGSQRNTINFTGDSWLPDDESSSIKPFRDHLHGGRNGVQGSNRWVRRAGKIPEGENGNMM